MTTIKFVFLALFATVYNSNSQVIDCNTQGGTCSCPTQQQYIGTTCELNCVGDQKCKDTIIRCRTGDACIVSCIGTDSCGSSNTNIDANSATDFTLRCQQINACKDASAECGIGKCALECDSNACDALDINIVSSTQAFQCTGDCSTNLPAEFTVAPTLPPTTTNTPTAFPSTSKPTSSSPTTSEPTTSAPTTTTIAITSAPTATTSITRNSVSSSTLTPELSTSIVITKKSTRSNATVTIFDGDMDYIITIEGNGIDNLKHDEIEAIIINAVGISGDDIIFTKFNDNSIVISMSISSDVSLDADTIKQNVEHGLVEEYGEDVHFSVTVSKTEDNTSNKEKHAFSIFISDIKVLISSIVIGCIMIICCTSLIIFYRNKNDKNKTLEDQKALSMSVQIEANSPTTDSKPPESMDYASSTEMQPVENGKIRLMEVNVNNVSIEDHDDGEELYDDKYVHNVDTKPTTKGHHVNDTIGDTTKLPAFQEEDDNESDDELYDIQPVQYTQTPNITRNDSDNIITPTKGNDNIENNGNDNTSQQQTVYID